MLKLKCAGAVSGAIEVSASATVGELFSALEKLAGTCAGSLKVITAGKRLSADKDAPLSAVGISSTTRLVVSRAGPNSPPSPADAHAARMARLDKISKAAEGIAKRSGGGSRPRFALETQAGAALQGESPRCVSHLRFGSITSRFSRLSSRLNHRHVVVLTLSGGVSEADRTALTQGLTLHQKGRQLMDAAGVDPSRLTDALDVLLLAEEAFGLASPELTARVDNFAILLLDVVWVMFCQRDANKLAAAVSRLRTCREGFTRAHGPNLERLRQLQNGFTPEMGLYVRLELLEGVAAYHTGDTKVAHEKLLAARDRLSSLQLSDDSLASLRAMGFTEQEAVRGLRFCGGDVAKAATFIVDQRARTITAEANARARAASERERRRYGLTPRGFFVDEDALRELEEVGFSRQLAAAGLRAHENSVQLALDALAEPFGREMLEQAAREAAEEWEKDKLCRRSRRDASSREAKRSKVNRASGDNGISAHPGAEMTLVEMGFEAAAVRQALSLSKGDVDAAAAILIEEDESTSDDTSDDDEEKEEEDAEIEADLVGGVASGDALKQYDIDLSLEGKAISEFLALVTGEVPALA